MLGGDRSQEQDGGAMLAAGCSQTGWEVVRLWMSLEGEWTRLQVDEKECGQGGQRGVRPEVGMEVEGQQESGLGGGVRCPLPRGHARGRQGPLHPELRAEAGTRDSPVSVALEATRTGETPRDECWSQGSSAGPEPGSSKRRCCRPIRGEDTDAHWV